MLRITGNKDDPVLRSFLGTENRSYLHEKIVQQVYHQTGGKVRISKQSDNELQSMMLQTAQSTYDSRPSVQELNSATIVNATKNIIGNVANYNHYIKQTMDPVDTSAFSVLQSQSSRASRELRARNVW